MLQQLAMSVYCKTYSQKPSVRQKNRFGSIYAKN